MDRKDIWHEFKCFGSATVGLRGQVVIPAHARKELGIEAGATLLAFSGPGGGGVIFFKADAVEQIVRMASENLTVVTEVLRSHMPSQAASRNSQEEADEKK